MIIFYNPKYIEEFDAKVIRATNSKVQELCMSSEIDAVLHKTSARNVFEAHKEELEPMLNTDLTLTIKPYSKQQLSEHKIFMEYTGRSLLYSIALSPGLDDDFRDFHKYHKVLMSFKLKEINYGTEHSYVHMEHYVVNRYLCPKDIIDQIHEDNIEINLGESYVVDCAWVMPNQFLMYNTTI